MIKPPFSRRRLMRSNWYPEMVAQDTDAIYHALAAEVGIAARRLMQSGWESDEAWKLAQKAADEIGAGWPGWQRVKVVQEALNALVDTPDQYYRGAAAENRPR